MKSKISFIFLLFSSLFYAQKAPDVLIHKMMITTGTVSSLEDVLENLQKDVFRFSTNTTTEDSELVMNEVATVFNIDSLTERYINNFKMKDENIKKRDKVTYE